MGRSWLADRVEYFDSSGIRRVFDLAGSMKNPVNLSIGQPHFDVPEPIKQAAIEAIQTGRNGYSPTQGIAPLREALASRIAERYQGQDRRVFVTSGTSGGLVLTMMALVNPGDEVIVFDPYFVMYPSLIGLVAGKTVLVDTYPDFQIDVEKVRAAITDRTKAILFNSPANPTGVVAAEKQVKALAELAAERDIALVSDEIYSAFSYGPTPSPAQYNPRTIVIDGFSKTYGATGWRVGWIHGPADVIDAMLKIQQYSFVCAPQPFQWASLAALEVDMTAHVKDYARKRDLLVSGLADKFELVSPGGAFYAYPRAPWGTGSQFVEAALAEELLIIPGKVFSQRDTHFRISYAAADEQILRGVEILRKLAERGA